METYELAEAADRFGVGDVVFGMCFLDITGYTRLRQKRGDAPAAQLAEGLGRLVQQASVKHGGGAVKWLGDGVMLHFPNPGPGVELKGAAGSMRLHAASQLSRAGSTASR